jgi:GTPase SAR1 family protein
VAQAPCPFCFRKIDTSKLWFECGNRGNIKCTKSVDADREKLTGSVAETFPIFAPPSGRGQAIECPECGGPGSRRACPDCHTVLPIDFLDSDSPMIGIVGSQGSGKTVLMTVLVKQLREVIGKRYEAAIRMATDNPDGAQGVNAYQAERERPLFQGRTLPLKTDAQAKSARRPLVLSWRGTRTRKLGGSAISSTILSFVDTAGEDLNTLDDTFTLQYLSVCDALIIAVDPFALPGSRDRLNLPSAAIEVGDEVPMDVINRITELLRVELNVKKNKKIKIPVAIVFTKIDAFFPTMDRSNPIMSASPTSPAYSEADGLAVHEHMRALLHEWSAAEIDIHMRLSFEDFRFFGVSALGAEPDYETKTVAAGGVQPHRVEDPVLWLLAKEGTVPRV